MQYNYLMQFLRAPLTFDKLVGQIDYVEGNKSCVTNNGPSGWASALSNNIMVAGKHYVSFQEHRERFGRYDFLLLGVMRPGEAMQSAKGIPLSSEFCENFTQRKGSLQNNNAVNCCMYYSYDGTCLSSDWWGGGEFDTKAWDGMEGLSSPYKIGMLLDLDEGILSVYKNGIKLGVMKRGLAGHYCWVVSLLAGSQIKMKRGTVPAS